MGDTLQFLHSLPGKAWKQACAVPCVCTGQRALLLCYSSAIVIAGCQSCMLSSTDAFVQPVAKTLQVLEGLVGVDTILQYLQGVSGHSTGAKSTQQLAINSIIGPDPMSNLKLVDSRYQLWQRFPATTFQEAMQFYQSKCTSHLSESNESVDSQT